MLATWTVGLLAEVAGLESMSMSSGLEEKITVDFVSEEAGS